MRRRQDYTGRFGKLFLLLLMPLAISSGGCLWRGYAGECENQSYTDRIIVSADGRQAAYVWTDRCWSLIPFPPTMPMDKLAEAKTEFLGWCNPDGTNHIVRIDAQTHIWGGFGNSRSILGVSFSPNGRHLAAVLQDRIEIVDTVTSQVRQLTPPNGKFTGACWFDNAQIAYATTSSTGERPKAVVKRSVYRQAIDNGEPVCLFSGTSARPDYDAFREVWAPGGQTVLLAEGTEVSRVGIASGAKEVVASVHHLDNGTDIDWSIHWKPDGEQIALLASDPSNGRLLLAGLLDCRSWRFTDLKAAFDRDVGIKWVMPVSWTPDGFLLVECPAPATVVLVRHNPWQVFSFRQRYAKELPHNMNGTVSVRHLVPGWLAIGPGAKDPMMYAVDYDGKKQIALSKYPSAFSADGRELAEVIDKGKVTIRNVALPAE